MTEMTSSTPASWRDYYELCKPRVVYLMILTSLVGMFLAVPGMVPVDILILGNLGIALVASSGAVVNHLIDRKIDIKMARTHNRPVAQGRVEPMQAAMFALTIGVAGMAIMMIWVNALSAWLTLASFIGYAFIYTGYLKHATPQNIVIGGLAGAMPPLSGLVCGEQYDRSRRANSRSHHFRLDAAPFLGARDSQKRRLRQIGRTYAASNPRRARHQNPYIGLHGDSGRHDSAAVFLWPQRPVLSHHRDAQRRWVSVLRLQTHVSAKGVYADGHVPLLDYLPSHTVRGVSDRSLSSLGIE